MADIVLCRIDSRLIHGQVTAQWIGYLAPDDIIVVDRETAASNFKQGIMDMGVPNEVETHYWSPEETVIRLKDDTTKRRMFLLVRNPEVLLQLLRGGIEINEADVGLMEQKDNAEKAGDQVWLDENDKEVFRKIASCGTVLYIQALPQDKKIDGSVLVK
jgi:mannose/fructose/N-acetylgalactosamine-specific phosphotransferase system component IIB